MQQAVDVVTGNSNQTIAALDCRMTAAGIHYYCSRKQQWTARTANSLFSNQDVQQVAS